MPSPISAFLISTNVPALARSCRCAPRAQVGERADRDAAAELRLLQVGVHDPGVVAGAGVDQRRQRADLAALADPRGAAQERARLDHRVAPDLDARVDQRVAGSTIVTPASACARWMRSWASRRAVASSTRVLTPSVSVGSVTTCRRPPCRGAQERQHVGQVELALGVVGGQRLERLEQVAARERVDAGVDLADRLLLRGRVAGRLGLHHPLDVAVGGAHDAAVARGVLELHGRHRGRRAAVLVGARERVDRLGGDQRARRRRGRARCRRRRCAPRRSAPRRPCRSAPPGSRPRRPRAARPRARARARRRRRSGPRRPRGRRRSATRSAAGRTAGAGPSGSDRMRVPSPAARISDGGSGHRGIVVSGPQLGAVGGWCTWRARAVLDAARTGFESWPPSYAVRLACEHTFVSRNGPRYSESEAREAVGASISFAGALRRLGMRPAGGNHKTCRSTSRSGESPRHTSTRPTRDDRATGRGRWRNCSSSSPPTAAGR